MKLVDFWHVPKQDVLLAVQVAGDEVSHGRVVHLCRVALDFNIAHLVKASAFSPSNVRSRYHYRHDNAHLQHTQQLLDISSLRLQQLVHHVTEMYTQHKIQCGLQRTSSMIAK